MLVQLLFALFRNRIFFLSQAGLNQFRNLCLVALDVVDFHNVFHRTKGQNQKVQERMLEKAWNHVLRDIVFFVLKNVFVYDIDSVVQQNHVDAFRQKLVAQGFLQKIGQIVGIVLAKVKNAADSFFDAL